MSLTTDAEATKRIRAQLDELGRRQLTGSAWSPTFAITDLEALLSTVSTQASEIARLTDALEAAKRQARTHDSEDGNAAEALEETVALQKAIEALAAPCSCAALREENAEIDTILFEYQTRPDTHASEVGRVARLRAALAAQAKRIEELEGWIAETKARASSELADRDARIAALTRELTEWREVHGELRTATIRRKAGLDAARTE